MGHATGRRTHAATGSGSAGRGERVDQAAEVILVADTYDCGRNKDRIFGTALACHGFGRIYVLGYILSH